VVVAGDPLWVQTARERPVWHCRMDKTLRTARAVYVVHLTGLGWKRMSALTLLILSFTVALCASPSLAQNAETIDGLPIDSGSNVNTSHTTPGADAIPTNTTAPSPDMQCHQFEDPRTRQACQWIEEYTDEVAESSLRPWQHLQPSNNSHSIVNGSEPVFNLLFFRHVQKTGGTTIRRLLSRLDDTNDWEVHLRFHSLATQNTPYELLIELLKVFVQELRSGLTRTRQIAMEWHVGYTDPKILALLEEIKQLAESKYNGRVLTVTMVLIH